MEKFLTIASTTVYIRSLAQQTQSFVLKQVLSQIARFYDICVIFLPYYTSSKGYLPTACLSGHAGDGDVIMDNNFQIFEQFFLLKYPNENKFYSQELYHFTTVTAV